MNLYIDRENLSSLVTNNKHELYNDSVKLMQKQLNTFFNFTKEQLAKDPTLLSWFSVFTSGVGATNTQTFMENTFPDRPLKSNSYITFNQDQLSACYLIDDERIETLQSKGAILIGKPGEEFHVFNQLFLLQGDYIFDKKHKIGDAEFKKWSDLEKYSTSLTDLIIVDPYIFIDSSLITSNLLPYLSNICSKSKCRINIVIYTNKEKISIAYKELNELIKQTVEKVTGIKPNLTLIMYRDQRGVKSFAEHDRTLCTNYYRVYSGDSFNYFKADGSKETKGREIQYSSLANKDNYNLTKELINDLQANINQIPKDQVEGDKVSNYLNFN